MKLDWISKMFHGLFSHETNKEVVKEKSKVSGCPFGFGNTDETEEIGYEAVGSMSPEATQTVQQSIINSAVYPEFDKAFEKFNPKTDVMVLSEEYIENFDHIYKSKLEQLGKNLIVFPKGFLVSKNVALVTAGYYTGVTYKC